MTLTLTCRRCNEEIAAEDEDELVVRVQAHVGAHSRAHGVPHNLSRKHILTRLRRQQAGEVERITEPKGAERPGPATNQND